MNFCKADLHLWRSEPHTRGEYSALPARLLYGVSPMAINYRFVVSATKRGVLGKSSFYALPAALPQCVIVGVIV